MPERLDYEISRKLKVILVMRKELLEGDGAVVTNLSDFEVEKKCVIRGSGFVPEAVREKAIDASALSVLTILFESKQLMKVWSEAFDPGWRAGPALSALVGVSVAGLGVLGYVRAGSKPSLISGGVIGSSIVGSSWLVRSGRKPRVGHFLCSTLSMMIVASMGPKAVRTKSIYPGGGIAAASAIAMAYNVAALI